MPEQFHSDTPVFRLTFSHIKCHIKLDGCENRCILDFKTGKSSSQPTVKTELKNGQLEFPDSISIPIDQNLIFDKNTRKEKCEVMLYRYYAEQKEKTAQAKDLKDSPMSKRQKEKKNLIGLTSVMINDELLSQKLKSFKITNTFDKDAIITCNVKITNEIFQNNEEKISSIGHRSNNSSIHNHNNVQKQKAFNSNFQIVSVQKQLNSKYKKNKFLELNISRMSEQNKPIYNKELGCYSERHMIDNYEERDLIKTERIFTPKNQILSGRIKRNDRNVQSFSERYERNDSHQSEDQDILQVCNNLQTQNNFLMNKIQNLENHILNKSPSTEIAQPEQTKLNKSQSLSKPSMIKKNKKFITSESTTFSKDSDPNQPNFNRENTQTKQTGGQSPKIMANDSNFSFRPIVKMISIKEIDWEHQSSKILTPKGQLGQKISFGFDPSSQVNPIQNNQLKNTFSRAMTIGNVIAFAHVPPIQPMTRQSSRSQLSRGQKIESSVSNNEKSISKSYKKFNSVKGNHITTNHSKIQILSEVQKVDFGLQTQIESFLEAPKLEISQSQLDTPIFVTVSRVSGPFDSIKHQYENQQNNNIIKKQDVSPQKSTLEEMNQYIEQRYRKTESYLKMANQKLNQSIKMLKIEKQQLKKELDEKRQISSDDFFRLQSTIIIHEMQARYYTKMVSEKDDEIKKLSKRLHETYEQNEKLQKNINEQKKTVAYFIKTSHVHDERQKELQMRLKFIEEQFSSQNSLMQSSLNNTKQRIVMPSPKVIYHSSIKKPNEHQSHIVATNYDRAYMTERNDNFRATSSSIVPELRFSVTKISQENKKNQSSIMTPFTKSQNETHRQKSLQSKGLSNIMKHSALNTKRTNDLSRQPNQFQNSFDQSLKKAKSKDTINIPPSFTEKKNLSILTKF